MNVNLDQARGDLLQLAKDPAGRPKSALLRDLLPEVEAALAAGVPRQRVLETLSRRGLAMSLNTFNSALSRLRAKLKQSPARSGSASVVSSTGDESPEAGGGGAPIAGADGVAPSTPASPDGRASPERLQAIMRSTPDIDALERRARQRQREREAQARTQRDAKPPGTP